MDMRVMRKFLHPGEDDNHYVPSPPSWTHTLIITFAILQMNIALIILLAYILNKKFRIHPGNISVGFAASALGLSVVWLLNLSDDLVHDHVPCAWLGFFSQLAEYCSSFYELGTLYYFYCYFKEIATPGKKRQNQERQQEPAEDEAVIDFVGVRNNPLEVSIPSSPRSINQPDPIVELTDEIKRLCPEDGRNDGNETEASKLQQQLLVKVVGVLAQLNEPSKKTQETLIQLSTRSNEILLHMGASSYAALQIQSRIHICVVIAAFAFVLIPSLTEDLGIDFYDVCSIEWVPEVQTTGITLTIIVTGLSAIVSFMILAYFWAKREIRERLKQEFKRMREFGNSDEISIREEHYVKHLIYYVFCSTIFGFGLAATNIYADYQTDYTSNFIEFCFIMHFLIIAIRGILLLWLKLAEPETRKAIIKTFKKLPKNCCKVFKAPVKASQAPSTVADNYTLVADP